MNQPINEIQTLDQAPEIAWRLRSERGWDNGGEQAELLATAPATAPADFADFWRQTAEAAQAIDLQIERRPSELSTDAFDVSVVYYQSWGGLRIGGWLVLPREGELQASVIYGHGYGGRAGPDLSTDRPPVASFFPCLRGFSLSRTATLPDNAHEHVLQGLDERETYVHRGCVVDLWQAARVLNTLFPSLSGRLCYRGGSFGGGIGALALPWGPPIARAHLKVPSFGNHRLRVTLPCVGSGQAIASQYRAKGESVLDVVDYFDASIAGQFIETPTQVAAALFDPAVPPAGQFAVYNAIESPKRLIVLAAAHCEYPEQGDQDRQVEARINDWLGFETSMGAVRGID